MIRIVEGDLLNAEEIIIGHQVNCKGVMNAGLGKQIREKYPKAYSDYMAYIGHYKNNPSQLLGGTCTTYIDQHRSVCHLWGQFDYGTNKRQTSYPALQTALERLRIHADAFEEKVALPYGLGCGLAGGDWDIVYEIIDWVFRDGEVTLYRM